MISTLDRSHPRPATRREIRRYRYARTIARAGSALVSTIIAAAGGVIVAGVVLTPAGSVPLTAAATSWLGGAGLLVAVLAHSDADDAAAFAAPAALFALSGLVVLVAGLPVSLAAAAAAAVGICVLMPRINRPARQTSVRPALPVGGHR